MRYSLPSLFLALWVVSGAALSQPSAVSIEDTAASTTSQCIRYLMDSPQADLAPFFGDADLVAQSCTCASGRVSTDPQLRGAVEAVGASSDPRPGGSTRGVLVATLLNCAADSLLSLPVDRPQYPEYLRRLSAALLVPAPWPHFRPSRLDNGVSCAFPEYPLAARRTAAEGTSVLALLVGKDGQVRDVRVVQSSGPTPEHKVLDLLAATSIFRCTMVPGELVGQRVESWTKLAYQWRLAPPK